MSRVHFVGVALAASIAVGAIFGSSSVSAATGLSASARAVSAAQTRSLTSQASKTINRGAVHAIPGTNCIITVGGWLNIPYRYPGVASQVLCASRHTVQVSNQIWWAGPNRVPVLFAQSGWSTYVNAFSTPEIDNYRALCPAGLWDWVSGTQVVIDGINRGGFFNSWGWWTACT